MAVLASPQADFQYAGPADDRIGPSLSIYADRGHLRDTIRDDVQAVGLYVREAGGLDCLLENSVRPLGDIVLLDCPAPDGAMLAALARLDMRAAHCGARLIVSTTLDGLDDVFGCMDQSEPHFLINPTRVERVIALGQALGAHAPQRLRELSQEDRMVLLRLTEQVSHIAKRLEGKASASDGASDAVRTTSRAFAFANASEPLAPQQEGTNRLVRATRPALPDPRLVRSIIRQRQMRAQFFDGDLFADPAWDMLLDLAAARAEHTRVSVTSLCIASGVPPTTALRWIAQMTDVGLFERVEDNTDKRRAFIVLSEKAADAMARYFAEIRKGSGQLI